MIRAAVAFSLLPVLAQADAWATFDRHCLSPLIATESPISPAFEWIYEDDEIDVHLFEVDALSLTVSVYKDGTFSPVGCEMHVNAADLWPEVASGFADWRKAVLANETFVLSDDGTLLSTDQREPLIRVFVIGPDQVPIPYVAVEETYLES